MGILEGLAVAAVVMWAMVLSAVDLRQRRLPNLLTLTGTVVILLGAVLCGRGLPAVLGAAALGAYEAAEIVKWGEAIRFSGARID